MGFLYLVDLFGVKLFVADQELDQAQKEVDQLDASSALHHGAMSQLRQDRLDWCLRLRSGLSVGSLLIISGVAGAP